MTILSVWGQERNLPKGEEVTFGDDREGMGVSWWSFSQPALFPYLSVQPSTWSTRGNPWLFRGYLLVFKKVYPKFASNVQFSSVSQLCLTLCDPKDCSTPRPPCPSPTPRDYPNSCPLSPVMPSNHLILCCPLLLLPSIFPSIRVFSKSQFFASGGQSIGVSALASVLPMNTQDWSPLGWTGWISLQSKGLSRIFSNTTAQKHQFFSAQFSL